MTDVSLLCAYVLINAKNKKWYILKCLNLETKTNSLQVDKYRPRLTNVVSTTNLNNVTDLEMEINICSPHGGFCLPRWILFIYLFFLSDMFLVKNTTVTKIKSNELNMSIYDISGTCQLGSLQCLLLYNQDTTELCTEHAQRSQLWHFTENRARIVWCYNPTLWHRAQIKSCGAALSLCRHKYKQGQLGLQVNIDYTTVARIIKITFPFLSSQCRSELPQQCCFLIF